MDTKIYLELLENLQMMVASKVVDANEQGGWGVFRR